MHTNFPCPSGTAATTRSLSVSILSSAIVVSGGNRGNYVEITEVYGVHVEKKDAVFFPARSRKTPVHQAIPSGQKQQSFHSSIF